MLQKMLQFSYFIFATMEGIKTMHRRAKGILKTKDGALYFFVDFAHVSSTNRHQVSAPEPDPLILIFVVVFPL